MKTKSDLDRLLSIVLLITFAACMQLNGAPGYSKGELLVKWQDGPESYAAAVGNGVVGSSVKRNFSAIGWQHVQLPPGMSVRDGMNAYHSLGTVLAVEPNGRIEPILPLNPGAADEEEIQTSQSEIQNQVGLHGLPSSPPVIPNDPMFNRQWYLKKIGATNAWAITTGSTNVVVAVLDTGVDYTHPDLAANMWRNPGETGLDDQGRDKSSNGIDDDANGYVDDVYGIDTTSHSGDPMDKGFSRGGSTNPFFHGTACAGIIGAVGNNGTGITGLNWRVQILAVRWTEVDRDNPPPERTYAEHILEAFNYVILMKRRGVNIVATSNSYGVGAFSQAVKDAVDIAGAEGILSVFGAGNNGLSNDLITAYPTSFNSPNIISVAASDASDQLASWSCYGRSSVHLAAPGVDILSTTNSPGYTPGFWGTSAACPQVAAAIALLSAAVPDASSDRIKAAILSSVDHLPAYRSRLITQGRLNVARALQQLTNPSPAPIVLSAKPANSRTRPNERIILRFSRPMNRTSVESGFAIRPTVPGRFEWSDADQTLEWVHETPLMATNYTGVIVGTVVDKTGTALDGNYNGTTELSPGDDFQWTFRFPVPNDDFANAEQIVGADGSVRGTTRNASPELDEPDHANNKLSTTSVWYRWQAETSSWTTFDVTQAAYDTLLAVYTGTALPALSEVVSDDNYGNRLTSRLSFPTEAGAIYSIALAGKSYYADKAFLDESVMGPFTLRWYPTPPPGFTGAQFSPTSAISGTKVTLTGTNFTGATDVLFNGARASFTNAAINNLDLRITAIVPPDATSGPITIVTPHGDVTSAASFQVLPPPLSVRWIDADGLEITWGATSSAFLLESSSDLRKGSWTAVMDLPLIADGQSRLKLTAPLENRFYRLKGK